MNNESRKACREKGRGTVGEGEFVGPLAVDGVSDGGETAATTATS